MFTPKQKKNLGFTLLEILIALFIFSILSLIMMNALSHILNSQAATTQKAQRLASLQIALLSLSRDIEQAVARPITRPDNQVEGWVGTPTGFTFTHAGLPNPLGELPRATLQRTRYEFKPPLLLRITWPCLDIAAETKPSSRPLLNEVSDVHFEYLDNKKQWQKTWPPSDQPKTILPNAVQVSLTLKNWGQITQLYFIAGHPLEKP